ncbi:MAG: hypothetical protein CM1200mP34_4340 [Verrucomicrobiales bacterium]|nr:MAG: hypothetical protein CM1200mP34_4340 [Verrucomicrobiales bacterium]
MVPKPPASKQPATLHWFTADTANADRRRGTRRACFSTAASTTTFLPHPRPEHRQLAEHKYKFDFYRGGHFSWKEGAPAVEGFNVNSHFRDGYLRENAIFAFLTRARVAGTGDDVSWISERRGHGVVLVCRAGR